MKEGYFDLRQNPRFLDSSSYTEDEASQTLSAKRQLVTTTKDSATLMPTPPPKIGLPARTTCVSPLLQGQNPGFQYRSRSVNGQVKIQPCCQDPALNSPPPHICSGESARLSSDRPQTIVSGTYYS
ncbi:hypothetical protein DPMN_013175 [Dreissena polymorpha]|uniref:Uncharacterized protein n=1 Tax=Dreissena polymorpha TaxID=45954 RepID=A0A9D4S3F4_DREPO|nr:hypothetical protein DPMN_013175 [Dreissena polymorpha]